MGKIIAAGVFIVRKDGKLLVCHPTNHDENFFSIPKGKVEKGESFVEAAFRETKEETNLDLRGNINFRILGLEPVMYSHKKKVLRPFLCVEIDNSTFDWDKSEIKCMSNVPQDRGGFPEMDGYRWVTTEEAKKLLHDTQVACLPKLKEFING
jgi:8-oxo-dGTP pyrophosphatase MutT (NUDIX family)